MRIALVPTHGTRVVPRVEDRRVSGSIVEVLGSCGRWVFSPLGHGPRQTLHQRFVRWTAEGMWERVFRAPDRFRGDTRPARRSAAGAGFDRSLAVSRALPRRRCPCRHRTPQCAPRPRHRDLYRPEEAGQPPQPMAVPVTRAAAPLVTGAAKRRSAPQLDHSLDHLADPATGAPLDRVEADPPTEEIRRRRPFHASAFPG